MTAITVLFLDLDDTLYPHGNGLWREISGRITQYMIEVVGLSRTEAAAARRRYSQAFGTSLAGLMADHDVPPKDYLRFVHDIPLDRYLEPNPSLLELLESLPQRKYIFSNASEAHVRGVLDHLGISGAIDGMIGIESLQFVNKPDLRAYARALELAGNPATVRCLFVDDRMTNLQTAQQMGMRTVLVGPATPGGHGADYRVETILDLRAAVPALMNPKEPE